MKIEVRRTHMKLINTTNNHAALVKSQLAFDALLIGIYSASNTDVVFTQANTL